MWRVGRLLRRVRRSLVVPQLKDVVRVEPRLDMTEVAEPQFEPGPDRAHELQHIGSPASAYGLVDLVAQAEIVITPHADRPSTLQQPGDLRHGLWIRPGHRVAENHHMVDALTSAFPQGTTQVQNVFVNVRE